MGIGFVRKIFLFLACGLFALAGCTLKYSKDAKPTTWVIPDKTEARNFANRQPFEKYVSDANLFTCLIPKKWNRILPTKSGLDNGMLGLEVFGPLDKNGVGINISIDYYTDNNPIYTSYADFVKIHATSNIQSPGNVYGPVQKVVVNKYPALEFNRQITKPVKTDNGYVSTVTKQKFIVIPVSKGFFVLRFYGPDTIAKEMLPIFEKTVKSFKYNS
jgi:hypothetical protein